MAKKTNFETNGNKYFRVTLTIGYDENGKQKQKTFYGKTKKEAEAKKQEYLDNLNNGITNKTLYLSATIKMWLYEVVKNSVKESTFERYEGVYRNYIKDSEIALLEIKNISNIVIQKYYNKLSKTKTASQIKSVNKLLKYFFNYCVYDDIIRKNPCNRIIIKDKNVKNNDNNDKVFSIEDIIIISNSKPCLSKYLGLLCISTGLRRGEALGLKWSDINFEDNYITISRAIRTYTEIDLEGNRRIITKPTTLKTKNSQRIIPLNNSLKLLLLEIKEFFNERKIIADTYYSDKYKEYVFVSETGTLIDSSNLSRSWKRYLNRIGVKYKNFHCTRHTYVTIQYENNIKSLTISKVVGHSNTDITERIYTHISNKEISNTIDVLSLINNDK